MRRALLLLGLLWSGPAFAACTVDPANVNTNIALSNTNHTWTSTSAANGTARATTGFLAGAGSVNANYKLYFETTASTVVANWGVGVDAGTDNLSSGLGDTFEGVALYNGTGHVLNNGTTGATYFTFTSGAIIGVAVDFLHQKLWWTSNGTTWNNDIIANQNPATNTGGYGTFQAPGPFGGGGSAYQTVYPAFGTNGSGNVGIYNGGDTLFTYTAPAGFTAWCGTPLTSTPQYFRGGP